MRRTTGVRIDRLWHHAQNAPILAPLRRSRMIQ
jgi:hypothetical protein